MLFLCLRKAKYSRNAFLFRTSCILSKPKNPRNKNPINIDYLVGFYEIIFYTFSLHGYFLPTLLAGMVNCHSCPNKKFWTKIYNYQIKVKILQKNELSANRQFQDMNYMDTFFDGFSIKSQRRRKDKDHMENIFGGIQSHAKLPLCTKQTTFLYTPYLNIVDW